MIIMMMLERAKIHFLAKSDFRMMKFVMANILSIFLSLESDDRAFRSCLNSIRLDKYAQKVSLKESSS